MASLVPLQKYLFSSINSTSKLPVEVHCRNLVLANFEQRKAKIIIECLRSAHLHGLKVVNHQGRLRMLRHLPLKALSFDQTAHIEGLERAHRLRYHLLNGGAMGGYGYLPDFYCNILQLSGLTNNKRSI